MSRELELKLEVESDDLARLRAHPALIGQQGTSASQLSVYFDTNKSKLRKAGYSLRVRSTQNGYIQTIKPVLGGAGLFDRDEWEAPVSHLFPDAGATASTPLAVLLTPRLISKLRPVVRAEVERTKWEVDHGDSRLEVVLDVGTIRGGSHEQPLVELEIELRDGIVEDVLDFARQLGEQVRLQLGVVTKADRGFALADGSLEAPAKAGPTKVNAAMTVAHGFREIVYACLKHFRLNEPLLVRDRNPDALHQARVAMRRLRSAFSLFRPAVDDAKFQILREELRWFTAQLGEARNLDVFIGNLEQDHARKARLEADRQQAYDLVIKAVASQRFRDLMLDLVAWAEVGEWRYKKKAAQALVTFTDRRIDKLWRSIELAGAQLGALEEEPRHRLRIQIKKLRYALDFMAEPYSLQRGKQKKFMKVLEELQEQLGFLNDLATARSLSATYSEASEAGKVVSAPTTNSDAATYLRKAQSALRRLQRAGAFWRKSPL
jgi:inorganic triphosphatase YgiF